MSSHYLESFLLSLKRDSSLTVVWFSIKDRLHASGNLCIFECSAVSYFSLAKFLEKKKINTVPLLSIDRSFLCRPVSQTQTGKVSKVIKRFLFAVLNLQATNAPAHKRPHKPLVTARAPLSLFCRGEKISLEVSETSRVLSKLESRRT